MLFGALQPGKHTIEPNFHFGFTLAVNVVTFLLLYLYNFWIIRCGLGGWKLVATGLLGSLCISTLMAVAQWHIETAIFGDTSHSLTLTIIQGFVIAVVAYLVSHLLYDVTMHQQTIVENEHLQAENMRIRYETLQQQVSPHFLFNSLNTLDGLIGVDNDSAHLYLHSLSDMFRYSLGHHESVTLAEELEFTHNYIDMMQIRFGRKAIVVDEDIAPSMLDFRLPAISLQLLVENAVKHNVVTQRTPLRITIKGVDGQIPMLVVSNAKQPKEGQDEGAGIGLANLSGRYNLLYHRDINIYDTTTDFIVELPLSDIKEPKETTHQRQ